MSHSGYENPIEQAAVSAYIGLAIGDALGATVEFMSANEILDKYGMHNKMCGGGWLKLKAGEVTDDTSMSLALGEAILQSGGVKSLKVAEAFSQWLLQNPVDVGNTVKRGILHYRYSGSPMVKRSETAAGNGACMRTLPVALATLNCDEQEIIAATKAQAHTTHNNALSDAATGCVVHMLQLAIRGADKEQLLNYVDNSLLENFPLFEYRNERIDNPTGYIVDTMRAVLQALVATDNFTDCLVNVVNRGGDADTTGAIAGMLAGALYRVDTFPAEWLKTLNKTIRTQCEQQALDLLRLSEKLQKMSSDNSENSTTIATSLTASFSATSATTNTKTKGDNANSYMKQRGSMV